MKKLLALLSSVIIAGSSAAAVVSCGIDAPYFNNDDDNASANDDNNARDADSASKTDNRIPDAVPSNTGNNKHNNTNPVTPGKHDQTVPEQLANVEANVKTRAQSNVLQDLYGINGDYLNKQLGGSEKGYVNIDGVNHDGVYGNESSNPFINFLVDAGILKPDAVKTINAVLPMLNSVDTPSPTQLAGLVSQVSSMAGILGGTINGLVKDEDVPGIKEKAESIFTPANKAIIDSLIDSDNKLDSKYDNLTLGQSLDSIIIGVAYVMSIGTSDADNGMLFSDLSKVENTDKAIDYIVKRAMELMNTPKIESAVFSIGEDSTTLTIKGSNLNDNVFKLGNWQLANGNDSLITSGTSSTNIKSVAKGKTKDKNNKDVDDDSTIVITFDSDQLSNAGEYSLINQSLGTSNVDDDFLIKFTSQLSDVKIARSSATAFDINTLLGTDGINALTDMIKMLGMYIAAFDNYKYTNIKDIDNNHVFKVNDSEPIGNYEAISAVRKQTIGSQKNIVDILELITNISYYLGSLDKQDGVYKLQAFLAMFLVDDDKSSATKFLLNWDNKPGADGWTDAIDGESKNMTPLSKLIYTFISDFLGKGEPDDLKAFDGLLGIVGFDWANITTMAKHNVYVLLQSMAWNRGFEFSNEKLGLLGIKMRRIDQGFDDVSLTNDGQLLPVKAALPFHGLQVLPQWSLIENQGVLSYLFGGNIYEFLNEVATSPKLADTFNALDNYKSGTKDKITGGVTDLMSEIKPYSSQAPTSETIELNSKFKEQKQIVFKANGLESILNTKLDASKENSISWGKNYDGPYPAPEIDNVINSGYDSSSKTTTLIIHAKNVYHNKGGKAVIDDFAKGLKLNNNSIANSVTSYTSVNGANSYLQDVTFTARVSGTVSQNSTVSTSAIRFMGTSGFFGLTNNWSTKDISNSIVNIAWSKDELKVYNSLGIDFGDSSLPNKNSISLSMADIQRLSGLTITDENGNNLISKIDPTLGTTINMQSIAAWKLTDLLGVLGVKGFVDKKSPLGPLPIADSTSLGGVILELGNIISKPDKYNALETILKGDNFSYKQFKHLVDVIFGDNAQDNIVNKVIDAIKAKDVSAAFNDVFGIKDKNTYDANKLLGTLIATFTDGQDPYKNSGLVYGVGGDTTLWSYLLDTHNGVIRQAWNVIDNPSPDNKELMNKLANLDNFKFDLVSSDKDNKDKVTKAIYSVAYKYSYSAYIKNDKDVSIQTKDITGNYTITATANGDKWDYLIAKN